LEKNHPVFKRGSGETQSLGKLMMAIFPLR